MHYFTFRLPPRCFSLFARLVPPHATSRVALGLSLWIFGLLFFVLSSMAAAASVTVAWDAVSSPEVAGYKVYYGNASQTYSSSVNVGNTTTAALSGLDQSEVYYLAVTAYDVDGNESDFSNEVMYDPTQVGIAFAVNAGGLAYTDANGIKYQADGQFSESYTYVANVAIAGTQDDTLYQSARYSYGDFSYTIPVANGDYVVTLKFAETWWTQVGQRVFNVLMEGVKVISNLDIVARVGPYKAYDVIKTVHVSDGKLTISFQTVVDAASVSAIIVEPAKMIFAVNAGGQKYVDANGINYQADGKFSGGNTHTTSATIGTKDAPLYQSERYGNFSYTIPVANGDYVVVLKFAEIDGAQVGQRVFNVLMEGVKVISHLDLMARAGANKAYNVTKTVHVSDGALTINFQPMIGNATVSAITVLQRGVAP
jgi:Malectin domain/Fibronectin type III domain